MSAVSKKNKSNEGDEIRMIDINVIKEKYSTTTGKTDAIYSVVLFNCNKEQLDKFTKDNNDSAKNIKDTHKRARAKKAYYAIKCFSDKFADQDNHIFNVVIMMDVERDYFSSYNLTKSVVSRLNNFKCYNIWIKSDNRYLIKELEDYLWSDKFYHMFRVKGNLVRYIRLGKSKRVESDRMESSKLDLVQYVSDKIMIESSNCTDRFLAYGVSGKLAALQASNIYCKAYDILNRDISDDEAILFIEKMEQSDYLDRLDVDLDLIQNSKTMDRVIFKKDFNPPNLSKLQRLYIDTKMHDKFMDNCTDNGVDISFEIIKIDAQVKGFVKNRETALDKYGGVIGITYY
jgi:hypothetical protein